MHENGVTEQSLIEELEEIAQKIGRTKEIEEIEEKLLNERLFAAIPDIRIRKPLHESEFKEKIREFDEWKKKTEQKLSQLLGVPIKISPIELYYDKRVAYVLRGDDSIYITFKGLKELKNGGLYPIPHEKFHRESELKSSSSLLILEEALAFINEIVEGCTTGGNENILEMIKMYKKDELPYPRRIQLLTSAAILHLKKEGYKTEDIIRVIEHLEKECEENYWKLEREERYKPLLKFENEILRLCSDPIYFSKLVKSSKEIKNFTRDFDSSDFILSLSGGGIIGSLLGLLLYVTHMNPPHPPYYITLIGGTVGGALVGGIGSYLKKRREHYKHLEQLEQHYKYLERLGYELDRKLERILNRE